MCLPSRRHKSVRPSNMPALKAVLEELVARYPVNTEVNRKKGKDLLITLRIGTALNAPAIKIKYCCMFLDENPNIGVLF